MHFARLVIELDFPEQLDVLGIGWAEELFVFLPVGALWTVAVRQPIGAPRSDSSQRERQHCGYDSHKYSLRLQLLQPNVSYANSPGPLDLEPNQAALSEHRGVIVNQDGHDMTIDDV